MVYGMVISISLDLLSIVQGYRFPGQFPIFTCLGRFTHGVTRSFPRKVDSFVGKKSVKNGMYTRPDDTGL